MGKLPISKRLKTLARMVGRGNRLADVGCDHAYLPIYLLEEGGIPFALAMDINRGPLEAAKVNASLYQVDRFMDFRLSDGLACLGAGEVDTITIAGMGGGLIERILEEGQEVAKAAKELILSPQSEIWRVRVWLEQHGWTITEEAMVKEDGKFYTVMKAEKGAGLEEDQEIAPDLAHSFGAYLLLKRDPVLQEFLAFRKRILMKIAEELAFSEKEGASLRKKEVDDELLLIKKAEAYYEM